MRKNEELSSAKECLQELLETMRKDWESMTEEQCGLIQEEIEDVREQISKLIRKGKG